MRDPIRALVIEDRRSNRCIAARLLESYDLDFTWQHAASVPALRTVAQAFNPNLVFSANALTASSRPAAVEMLLLMSLRTAVIHVVEVDDLDGASPTAPAAFESKPSRRGPRSALNPPSRMGTSSTGAQPATHWHKCFPSLLESSADVVAMSDSSGWLTYANSHACRALGQSRCRPLGTMLGLAYEFAATGRDPHRIAYFDPSTGLPDPAHLSDLILCAGRQALGSRVAFPIVALDLPGLGVLHELCGREMSDEVLRVVESELRSGSARCGMVARVGADDLLLVLPEPSDPADAAVAVSANRRSTDACIESAQAPAPAIAAPVPVHCSINAAPPEKPRQPLEADLDDALKRHAIRVHYQPQYELQSGRGCGVEALARWMLSSGDNVAPAIFIPAAEKSGLIDALGASVLTIACDTAAAWRGHDAERSTVSVNVSTLQMNQDFFKILSQALERSGLRAGRLELEIAESAVIENMDAAAGCLAQWKQLGVRVAVNHSGTNYSSLKYLCLLPIDRLKLDRCLIQRMTLDPASVRVIHALIGLGAQLGIEVIAEGVETEPQFALLRELECPQAQGYLLGRPLPAVQAQVALRRPWGNLPKSARPSLPKSNPAGIDVHEIGARVEAHTAAG